MNHGYIDVDDAAAEYAEMQAHENNNRDHQQTIQRLRHRDEKLIEKCRRLGLVGPGEYVEPEELPATLKRYYSEQAAIRVADQARRRGRQPWEFLTGDDLLAMDEPQWLAKGLLASVGLGSLNGATGSHKTGLLVDLTLSVTNGLSDWMGFPLDLRGPAVFILLEGKFDFHERLKAWLGLHPGTTLDQFIAVVEPDLNLSSERDLEDLYDWIEDLPWMEEPDHRTPRLIVIDTQGLALPGVSEDSATEMNKALRQIKNFAASLNCLVILAHHTGWDTSRERGSSAQRQAVDVSMLAEGNEAGGWVSVNKVKAGPKPPTWAFVAESHGRSIAVRKADNTEALLLATEGDDERKPEIRGYVADHPDRSMTAVASFVGGNRAQTIALIKSMIVSGDLVNAGTETKFRLQVAP